MQGVNSCEVLVDWDLDVETGLVKYSFRTLLDFPLRPYLGSILLRIFDTKEMVPGFGKHFQ
jgi:hypothetical protein